MGATTGDTFGMTLTRGQRSVEIEIRAEMLDGPSWVPIQTVVARPLPEAELTAPSPLMSGRTRKS